MSKEIIVRRWWDDTYEPRKVDHPQWVGPIAIFDFYTDSTNVWPFWNRYNIRSCDGTRGPANIGVALECLNADTDPVAPPVTTDQILERLERGEQFPEYTGEVLKRGFKLCSDPDDITVLWDDTNTGHPRWNYNTVPHIPGVINDLISSHYILGNGGMFAYDGAEQTLWNDEYLDYYQYGAYLDGIYQDERSEPMEVFDSIAQPLASIMVNLGKTVHDFRSSVLSYEVRGSLLHLPKFGRLLQWGDPPQRKTIVYDGPFSIKVKCRVRIFYPTSAVGVDEAELIYKQDWSGQLTDDGSSGTLIIPEAYKLIKDNIFSFKWESIEAPSYLIDRDGIPRFSVVGETFLDKEGWYSTLGYIDIDTGVSLDSLYTNRLIWFSGNPTSAALKEAEATRRSMQGKTRPRPPRVTWRSAV